MDFTRLPGPDLGGWKSFPYQLVVDEKGRPLLLSNEVVQLYLGYCARCHLDREKPQNFALWLGHEPESEKIAPPDENPL